MSSRHAFCQLRPQLYDLWPVVDGSDLARTFGEQFRRSPDSPFYARCKKGLGSPGFFSTAAGSRSELARGLGNRYGGTVRGDDANRAVEIHLSRTGKQSPPKRNHLPLFPGAERISTARFASS